MSLLQPGLDQLRGLRQPQELDDHGILQGIERLHDLLTMRCQPHQALLVLAFGQAVVQQAGHLALEFTHGPRAADSLDLVEGTRFRPGRTQELAVVTPRQGRMQRSRAPACIAIRFPRRRLGTGRERQRQRSGRFPRRRLGNQLRIVQVELPERLEVVHGITTAKFGTQARRQIGEQLETIARPALSSLLLLDDLSPDQPVGGNLGRVDCTDHAGTRSIQNLAHAAEKRLHGFFWVPACPHGRWGRWKALASATLKGSAEIMEVAVNHRSNLHKASPPRPDTG